MKFKKLGLSSFKVTGNWDNNYHSVNYYLDFITITNRKAYQVVSTKFDRYLDRIFLSNPTLYYRTIDSKYSINKLNAKSYNITYHYHEPKFPVHLATIKIEPNTTILNEKKTQYLYQASLSQ